MLGTDGGKERVRGGANLLRWVIASWLRSDRGADGWHGNLEGREGAMSPNSVLGEGREKKWEI